VTFPTPPTESYGNGNQASARGGGQNHHPIAGHHTAGVKAKPSGRPAAGLDPGSTPPTTGNPLLSPPGVGEHVDVYFDAPRLRA
jgi:hypothetical protein